MRVKEKVFVCISVALTFFLSVFLIGGNTIAQNSSNTDDLAIIDWESKYPYDTEIETVDINTSDKHTNFNPTLLSRWKNFLSKFGSIENDYLTNMYKHDDIMELCYWFYSRMANPTVLSDVVRLKNGYLTNSHTEEKAVTDEKDRFGKYLSLQNYLKTKNIDFLYILPPDKECTEDNELPIGVTSYANHILDSYAKIMEDTGTNYMDLRTNLHKDGLNHYSMFYKTDHHWTVDAGFWATSKITNEIRNRYGISIQDVGQFGTFSGKTYHNAMFGSLGHNVTHAFADVEDFKVLFPDFKTDFTLEIPSRNIDVTGNFEDIFINYEALNKMGNSGGGYAYETLLYGNAPYTKITNNNNPDAPKLLMIKDSFALAIAPYLALSCSELVMLDVRKDNGNFTGSVVNCINSFNPDIVLAILSNPSNLILNKTN